MPHETTPALPVDLVRVLAAKTFRDAGARALILAAMREFGRDAPPYSSERLEKLIRVDEHFQSLLLYDQLEFLRGPSTLSESEREFAQTVQRICLEAANGFQRYLRHRDEWTATPASANLLFRVTGLALNAIHCFVKWGYFLGDRGRSVPWKQLHALYWLAESEGFAQVPFMLHGTEPSFKPSVQSLYLRTLVVDLVNSGNLSRVQIEIANGWFSSWCGDYDLETDLSPKSHIFYVDLVSDHGLSLVRAGSTGETRRYVRADDLKAQLEEVRAGLRKGRLYAGHGAGAVFPVEVHVTLLATIEKLYQSMILAGAEKGIEERERLEDREVDVVIGMDRILAKIVHAASSAPPPTPAEAREAPAANAASDAAAADASGLSLAPIDTSPASVVALDPDVEVWRVKDMSSKGFGLLVDKASADAVLLQGVIGIRNQASGNWMVATVVRKLAQGEQGEILAGVEVLSFRPLRIEFAPATDGPNIEALFLPGNDAKGKHDTILVRTADYSATTPYRLAAGGAIYRMRLNRVAQKGADWVRVRFEIESKS